MHRLFGCFGCFRERFVKLFAHLGDDRAGVKAILAGIYLPQRRVVFDLGVEERLRDRGIVHFAMAVPAESDEIDYHVARELRAIAGGNFTDPHNGARILSIDVKDGDRLPLRQIGGETRGVQFTGRRSEAD